MHAHGILHCDIHAKYFLVANTGVKMMDFGLSKDNVFPAEHQLELENVHAMSYMNPKLIHLLQKFGRKFN